MQVTHNPASRPGMCCFQSKPRKLLFTACRSTSNGLWVIPSCFKDVKSYRQGNFLQNMLLAGIAGLEWHWHGFQNLTGSHKSDCQAAKKILYFKHTKRPRLHTRLGWRDRRYKFCSLWLELPSSMTGQAAFVRSRSLTLNHLAPYCYPANSSTQSF